MAFDEERHLFEETRRRERKRTRINTDEGTQIQLSLDLTYVISLFPSLSPKVALHLCHNHHPLPTARFPESP